MDGSSEREAKSLFLRALEVAAEERGAFLDRECPDDGVRARVERLLLARLEAPELVAEEPSAGRAGARIGRYTLVERLGEGGYGTVWLAAQREPIQREVALKIVKVGMDTREVVARFESERQVLALMDHPNIARILDGGATPEGRPYFVMELVRGVPITEFCDREELAVKERLALFLEVCAGVQHAHQRGVLHRDLKPSNVLVGDVDDRPVPKVIDFGIAKATGAGLAVQSQTTARGLLLGTPAYMAPERCKADAIDVDTRADVYSLGVILYELLTGRRPFELVSLDYEELVRTIREREPATPSLEVRTPRGGDTRPAQRRRSTPQQLARAYRGDLDWIVMKALAKDRERRYESVSALAADLERFLTDRPVSAGPPSTAYRIKKYVKRHRAGVAASAAVALTALVGLVLVLVSYREARFQRDSARELSRFWNEMLARVAPDDDPGRGKDVLLRDVLDMSSEQIEEWFGEKPQLEAEIRFTFGVTYSLLGEPERAEPQLERTLALSRQVHGDDSRETLATMNALASLRLDQGRYPEAEELYREIVDRGSRAFPAGDPGVLKWRIDLGNAYIYRGRLEQAGDLLEECLTSARRIGEDAPITLRAISLLAGLRTQQDHYEEAEALLSEGLEKSRRTLGPGDWKTVRFLIGLGVLYENTARYAEAEKLIAQALEVSRRTRGDDHLMTLRLLAILGRIYAAQGRYEEAEACCREASEKGRGKLGDGHPETLEHVADLARLYDEVGRLEEAESLYLECLEGRRAVLGDDHPDTIDSINSLGVVYSKLGRIEEAEPLFEECIAWFREHLGPDDRRTLICLGNLGSLLLDKDRFDEAEPLILACLEGERRVLPKDHPTTIDTLENLAHLRDGQRRFAEAKPLYLEVLEARRQVLGDGHSRTIQTLNDVARRFLTFDSPEEREPETALELALEANERTDHGDPNYLVTLTLAYLLTGDFERAIETQTRALELLPEDPDGLATIWSIGNLGITYARLGRLEEAEALLVKALDWCHAHLEADHADTLRTCNNLGSVYEEQGRYAEAKSLYLEALDGRRRVFGDSDPKTVQMMNRIAWWLLTIDSPEDREPGTALELALEANERTDHENPYYLDTLALAYHLTGDSERAMETQGRALELLPEDSDERGEFEARLAEFEDASAQTSVTEAD